MIPLRPDHDPIESRSWSRSFDPGLPRRWRPDRRDSGSRSRAQHCIAVRGRRADNRARQWSRSPRGGL